MKKFLLFCFCAALCASCDPDPTPDPVDPDPTGDPRLGYDGSDTVSNVPTTVTLNFSNTNIPASYDITDKFPPIGDQGAYGTCVAWAVGYNAKTASEGIQKGLTPSQLAQPSNQISPKDLFLTIPDNLKGENCGGTYHSAALNVLQGRGAATMATVPYTGLANCSQANAQGSWASDAANHKIKSYRKIDANVTMIKQCIANNIPVIIGAKLSDNFMTWNSESVLSANTTYNQVGQHAGHALAVSGYDDGKGAGGAFKVVNSWGNNWGAAGYIWIDYNFFVNEFCTDGSGERPLFIIDNGAVDPNTNPTTATGVDLASWAFYDYTTYQYTQNTNPYQRSLEFNLYNIGNQTAPASADWSFVYIYYNAYDANDYGIILQDDFNTSIAQNTYQCNNSGNYCVINLDMPGGSDFANLGFGTESVVQTYDMPALNGYYYLVMLIDLGDKFAENDEQNNLFYTTVEPKYFNQGYSAKGGEGLVAVDAFKFENKIKPTKSLLKDSKYKTAVTPQNRNAYRPDEIVKMLKIKKANGDFDNNPAAGQALTTSHGIKGKK